VSRLLRTLFDRRGRELDLTRSQWWALTAIYLNEGATQSELADFMELEKATVGRLLDRLAEKAWIERRLDAVDRRVRRVYLTETVQGLMRSLRGVAAEVRGDALRGLSAEERDRFIDTLIKVKGNLLNLDDMRPETGSRSMAMAADD
jgi:DNA-binding MarR family transcriptional regulator